MPPVDPGMASASASSKCDFGKDSHSRLGVRGVDALGLVVADAVLARDEQHARSGNAG